VQVHLQQQSEDKKPGPWPSPPRSGPQGFFDWRPELVSSLLRVQVHRTGTPSSSNCEGGWRSCVHY